MTMTKPTSEQVTFTAAGSGATLRNLVDKVREVVSVKDFGAVGNGLADDSAAVQAAIAASYGKTLFFPEGTYKITTQYGGLLAGEIVATGNIYWLGESPNAILKFDPPANTEGMFGFLVTNRSVQVRNLTFDLNNKGSTALELESLSASMADSDLADVYIDNVTVKNARMYTTTIGAYAVYCRGGFKSVRITNSTFSDLTIDSGLTPGHVGGAHVVVAEEPTSPTTRYCKWTSIERCMFSNVTCADPAVNADMDGIRVFSPLPAAFGGTELVPSVMIVQDCVFSNCWTRDIKSKVQLNSVEGCTFRQTSAPTGGSIGPSVDFQHNGGVIENCKSYYKDVTKPTVFNSTINSSTEDSLMGFMCTNNQIYHTGSGGLVYPFATFGNATGIMSAVIRGNTVIANVDALLNFNWLGTTANFVCNDNTVKSASVALVRVTGNGGSARGNVFSNVQLNTASPIPVARDQVPGTSAFAIINGSNNVGILNRLGDYPTNNNVQMLRGAMLGPATWDSDGFVGSTGLETATVEDDGTHAFSRRGQSVACIYMLISSSFNRNAYAVFSADTGGTVSISAGTAVSLGTTTNPDVDGNLNVWIDASTGRINIKNRLGSTRYFTLQHLG